VNTTKGLRGFTVFAQLLDGEPGDKPMRFYVLAEDADDARDKVEEGRLSNADMKDGWDEYVTVIAVIRGRVQNELEQAIRPKDILGSTVPHAASAPHPDLHVTP